MVSGILSLNDEGNAPNSASEAPAASVAPVWLGPARVWALAAARCGGGGGAPCPAARGARSPGRAGGLGRRRNTPAARERQGEPGTSPKALALPGAGVQQTKEQRRKRKMRQGRGERERERGRGEWLRAEIEAEVENPLSRAESEPRGSAKKLGDPLRFVQLVKM